MARRATLGETPTTVGSHMSHPLIIWENPIPDDLRDPVLVCALDGWIDAGYGSAAAVGNLKLQIRTQRLLRFDIDELLDMRARRPVMRLINGVNTELRWPRLQIRHGRDPLGAHVLVLTGPEPDFRWNRFTDALMDRVEQRAHRDRREHRDPSDPPAHRDRKDYRERASHGEVHSTVLPAIHPAMSSRTRAQPGSRTRQPAAA